MTGSASTRTRRTRVGGRAATTRGTKITNLENADAIALGSRLPGQADLILDAAEAEFTRYGLRKSSVDDIATNASVSRSTLYRRFPNKEALFSAVVERVWNRSLKRINAAVVGLDPQAAVTSAFVTAMHEVNQTQIYQYLLGNDRNTVRLLADDFQAELLSELSDRICAVLTDCGATMPHPELRDASEVMIRSVFSLVQIRSSRFDLADDDALRSYSRRYLAPLIH